MFGSSREFDSLQIRSQPFGESQTLTKVTPQRTTVADVAIVKRIGREAYGSQFGDSRAPRPHYVNLKSCTFIKYKLYICTYVYQDFKVLSSINVCISGMELNIG